MRARHAWPLVLGITAVACGDDGGPSDPGVTTDHCTYVAVPATAGAGGTVAAGALEAGAGEAILEVPVGAALGGYTGRAAAQGNAGRIDDRDRMISGGFNPSIGVETAPRAKALALTAGSETVLIVKIDAIFVYEGMLFDLEQRLGAGFHGKVLLAASHSHSAWMQFTAHGALKAGGGELRDVVYRRFLDGIEAAARAALAARRPARIGFFVDRAFDPDDAINRDRRGENDHLPGGDRGDDHLTLIRVDGTDGAPIAIVPVFGEHGTILDQSNPLASNDAPGGIERVLEEQVPGAVVLHLQSAGGDTSPVGHGTLDCNRPPGDPGDPCLPFARLEGHGRRAAPVLLAAWQAAGAAMQDQLALEMLTRSVELGPDPATYTIRGGALAYAPFDLDRPADGVVYDGSGALASPIDEFNAPVGAALCEATTPIFPAGAMPGTGGLVAYGGCVRLDVAAEVLGSLLNLEIEVTPTRPICQTTRTTVSALRLGDHLLGTLPGEVTVLIADLVRSRSPVDPARTIVVGYAQGHVGYVLTPEDWVLGGYEPSITFWGPLEGEYLVERLAELMPLATTPAREDGAAGGTTRVATPQVDDGFPIDDPAPEAGSVPAAIDEVVWLRSGRPAFAQPPAQVPRVAGLATFVWTGDDPLARMPRVTLERETDPGTYLPVTRRSGRPVQDGDFLLTYTPVPLRRTPDPIRHVWAVEWQAVPWLGAEDLDDLDARAGVPLGRYRFHVAGAGWTLTSDPFEVVAGSLGVTAVRDGATVTATVTIEAPRGFRLLDLAVPSNRPVPLRSQPVTFTVRSGSGVELLTGAALTSATGQFTIEDPLPGDVAIHVVDRFGNPGQVAVASAAPRDPAR
jgi:neutral ceramidase